MKKIISSWIGIFVGCTILAAGFVYFINPYNLVPGGVYGASIVLHNLFPSIQVGTFGYMFDIPLLIISVLVLGHYYQKGEIQDIADYVGDSLALAQWAARTEVDIIVMCGVHFMGETAKVLCPDKKVV